MKMNGAICIVSSTIRIGDSCMGEFYTACWTSSYDTFLEANIDALSFAFAITEISNCFVSRRQ